MFDEIRIFKRKADVLLFEKLGFLLEAPKYFLLQNIRLLLETPKYSLLKKIGIFKEAEVLFQKKHRVVAKKVKLFCLKN